MVEVIGRSAPIPYVEARVGISIKICCFFGTGVKRVYADFFWDRLSMIYITPLASHVVREYLLTMGDPR
jgi:hypothetical protein